jgi:phenylpyruvate tautomerase PptA (4-oxalocrotonate tautomerase family)
VGSIRRGRTPEVKARLHDDIIQRVAAILSVPREQVQLTLQEVPAEWAMEGGEVLPTPGSDDDWMKKHWSTEGEDATEPPARGVGRFS